MEGFGDYPTRYCDLTNTQLYAMYFESWNAMKSDEKLDLLQETVNRDAAEKGMIGAPRVELADLAPSVEGQQRNGFISVNREMVLDGTQTVEYQGQAISRTLEDANLRAMTVCFHENAHAYQEQCVSGIIPCADLELLAQYKANDFDVTPVFDENGQIQRGLQYMRGEKNYYFYYLQATERDAYKTSEAKTQAIMQQFSERFGGERSFQAYVKELQTNGYRAMEQRAINLFQNPNIEKEINQVLTNEFYNKNLPVTPELEKAVRAEMIESYRRVIGEAMQSAAQQRAGNVSNLAHQTGVQPMEGTMQQTGVQLMEGTMQQTGVQPMAGDMYIGEPDYTGRTDSGVPGSAAAPDGSNGTGSSVSGVSTGYGEDNGMGIGFNVGYGEGIGSAGYGGNDSGFGASIGSAGYGGDNGGLGAGTGSAGYGGDNGGLGTGAGSAGFGGDSGGLGDDDGTDCGGDNGGLGDDDGGGLGDE